MQDSQTTCKRNPVYMMSQEWRARRCSLGNIGCTNPRCSNNKTVALEIKETLLRSPRWLEVKLEIKLQVPSSQHGLGSACTFAACPSGRSSPDTGFLTSAAGSTTRAEDNLVDPMTWSRSPLRWNLGQISELSRVTFRSLQSLPIPPKISDQGITTFIPVQESKLQAFLWQ